MVEPSSFANLKIAVLPFPALGDALVTLRLAWIFRQAGAAVSFYSSLLWPARAYFPWLTVLPNENLNLAALLPQFDLIVGHSKHLPLDAAAKEICLQASHLVCFKSKNQKGGFAFSDRKIRVRGHEFPNANRPICLDSKAGLSMVQWMDHYAREAFGLECPEPLPIPLEATTRGNVVIFPTSALAKKNYPLRVWLWLARRLTRNGWHVEFACMPEEQAALQRACTGFAVQAFQDIKALMDYLAQAEIVISNDSGGGHMASLMGKRTFTITRRKGAFSWRPGFNERNEVLSPLIGVKLFGRHIWRPFIPVWRILTRLGKAKARGF